MNNSASLLVILLSIVIGVDCEETAYCNDLGCGCESSQTCSDQRLIITCSKNLSQHDPIPLFIDRNRYNYYNGYQAMRCGGKGLIINHSVLPLISSTTLINYPGMYYLSLRNNQIEDLLPDTFNNMTNLISLNISNNQITTIRRGTFNLLHQLRTLHLEDNKIKQIEPHSFLGCTNLETIYLGHNNISEIPEDSFEGTELSYLDLSHNKLGHFKFVRGKRFNFLDLSNNRIEQLSDWRTSYVANLSLSNNHLQEMLEIRAENTEVYLSHNNITTLNGSNTTNVKLLKVLDVSYNQINTMESNFFSTLSNLQKLYLQHNQIEKIDIDSFSTLTQLQHLEVSSNKIANFQRGTFANLNNLRILNISDNRLIEIHHDFALEHLQNLYFDNNRISTLDIDAIHQQSKDLKEISLSGNQWNCKDLMIMCLKLRNLGIIVFKGDTYNVENVQGISCEENSYQDVKHVASPNQETIDQVMNAVSGKFKISLNTAFEDSDFYKYFQRNYKNSNFFKYLDAYKFLNMDETNQTHAMVAGLTTLETKSSNNENGHGNLLILIFIGQIMIFCGIFILIYFKWSQMRKELIREIRCESRDPMLQMESVPE